MAIETEGRTLDSVERTCAIIELLLERDGLGVSEIADELELTPGTVHCYLNTLRASGYVVKGDAGYRLASRYVRLGEVVRNRIDGFDIIKKKLGGIAAECGERVQFAIEEQGKAVLIHQVSGEDAVNSPFATGQREHLHCVAIGKAILAQYSRDRVDSIVEAHGLPGKTADTITDREALHEKLETVGERGFAVDDEELVRGVRCVAVPIRRDAGVLGAISVSGPASRMDDERMGTDLLELLSGAANIIEVNSKIEPKNAGP